MELTEVDPNVHVGTADVLRCERTHFNQVNTNGDEQVDCKELANAIQAKDDHHIPQVVIDQLIERGNMGINNGFISFDEFYELIHQFDSRPFCKKFFHIPAKSQIKLKATDYWKDCKWMPPPIINLIIIILQIIIHIIDNSSSEWLKKTKEFSPTRKSEIWRYYTYSLVHANWPHVLGNSVFQLLFGTALEPLHGYRVFAIFVIGVFAGSLAPAVLDRSVALVGSSAGVYALIFSWVPDVFLNWAEQKCPMVSLMPVIMFLSWDFTYATMFPKSNKSYPAHISGGIGGILSGIIMLKSIKEHRFDKATRKIAMGLWIYNFSMLILLNYFYSLYQ